MLPGASRLTVVNAAKLLIRLLGLGAMARAVPVRQSIAARDGACGVVANARCPSGQCCSQDGWCGSTTAHCGIGCQSFYSASNNGCAGASTPAAPPTQRPSSAQGPTGPALTSGGCVDTYASCIPWEPSTCVYPGVPEKCPCMCLVPPSAPDNPSTAQPAVSVTQLNPATPGGGSVADNFTAQQWEQLFPNRNTAACQGVGDFYSYSAFVTAAAEFPGFGTSSSDPAVNKRELAAFLGQISHETTGGWPSAPGGPYAWGLCNITEGGLTTPVADYCAATAKYPCASGKKYFGRGPLQLSWNYNYIPAGEAIGFDGLNTPDIVASDPIIAFKTALWFWVTPQALKPSCHDVITGRYTQTSPDKPAGYGLLTNIINGGTECGQGTSTPQEVDRIGFYQRYCGILGVSPGDNLSCANQRPL